MICPATRFVLCARIDANVVLTSARGASSVHTIEKTLMNVSNNQKTTSDPKSCNTNEKDQETALRVSLDRSFEILKFLAEKIVAQIS